MPSLLRAKLPPHNPFIQTAPLSSFCVDADHGGVWLIKAPFSAIARSSNDQTQAQETAEAFFRRLHLRAIGLRHHQHPSRQNPAVSSLRLKHGSEQLLLNLISAPNLANSRKSKPAMAIRGHLPRFRDIQCRALSGSARGTMGPVRPFGATGQ